MTEVPSPKLKNSTEVTPVATIDLTEAPAAKWFRLRRDSFALVRYLLDTEVHTYAFSVAANAILSFIPFTVLLYTVAWSIFRSNAMVKVVNEMVLYYLPSTASQKFLTVNLSLVAARHGAQVFSLVVILIACTGIFLPLEVALNQAWGVTKNRNYLLNQTVALGLALLMVALAMISIFVNEGAQQILTFVFFNHTENIVYKGLSYLWLSISTGAAAIVLFFFIYWLLPNRKVPWKPVMRTAVVTGIVWLLARSIFVAVLPHLKLEATYGPFFISVGLLFWAYISGLILFAGAQFSVSRMGNRRARE
ncbi:MAG: YihY/virulence factor BrkB family protein [Terracidiphilus sp.]